MLAGHDIIFLGERGQAKTRMIRSLTGLLDEWMPIVAGSEINDDPYQPVSRYARELVAEHGEATPITWVHRDDRYGEKLATHVDRGPDRRGRSHQGRRRALPSTSSRCTTGWSPGPNRIFALNELPDLAEAKGQVLLNVLEERRPDPRLQDPPPARRLCAPPGRHWSDQPRAIITPLKDRWQPDPHALPARGGHRGRDHAPGVAAGRGGRHPRARPGYLEEIVATFSHLARSSSHVNQRSGVSVRLSVSNVEVLLANAPSLVAGGRSSHAATSSCLVDLEEDRDRDPRGTLRRREGPIVENMMKGAVLTVFKQYLTPERSAGCWPPSTTGSSPTRARMRRRSSPSW